VNGVNRLLVGTPWCRAADQSVGKTQQTAPEKADHSSCVAIWVCSPVSFRSSLGGIFYAIKAHKVTTSSVLQGSFHIHRLLHSNTAAMNPWGQALNQRHHETGRYRSWAQAPAPRNRPHSASSACKVFACWARRPSINWSFFAMPLPTIRARAGRLRMGTGRSSLVPSRRHGQIRCVIQLFGFVKIFSVQTRRGFAETGIGQRLLRLLSLRPNSNSAEGHLLCLSDSVRALAPPASADRPDHGRGPRPDAQRGRRPSLLPALGARLFRR